MSKVSYGSNNTGSQEWLLEVNFPSISSSLCSLDTMLKIYEDKAPLTFSSFSKEIASVSMQLNSKDRRHSLEVIAAFRDEIPKSSTVLPTNPAAGLEDKTNFLDSSFVPSFSKRSLFPFWSSVTDLDSSFQTLYSLSPSTKASLCTHDAGMAHHRFMFPAFSLSLSLALAVLRQLLGHGLHLCAGRPHQHCAQGSVAIVLPLRPARDRVRWGRSARAAVGRRPSWGRSLVFLMVGPPGLGNRELRRWRPLGRVGLRQGAFACAGLALARSAGDATATADMLCWALRLWLAAASPQKHGTVPQPCLCAREARSPVERVSR
jgi:hypothetical protein